MASTVTSLIGENKTHLTVNGHFEFSIYRDSRTFFKQALDAGDVAASAPLQSN